MLRLLLSISTGFFPDDFETSVKAIDSFSLRNATTKKKL